MANNLTSAVSALMTSKQGMNTTQIMKALAGGITNDLIRLDSKKAKANNRLKEVSSDTLDHNTYAIQERLAKLGEASPDLYVSFAGEVELLDKSIKEIKSKIEKFAEQYKVLSTEINTMKKETPETTATGAYEKKINTLIEELIKQRQLQIDIEQKQNKLFNNIFIAAGQAGVALPAEKKRL